jgi:hypothetical protein
MPKGNRFILPVQKTLPYMKNGGSYGVGFGCFTRLVFHIVCDDELLGH